jgi:hypothetical protein
LDKGEVIVTVIVCQCLWHKKKTEPAARGENEWWGGEKKLTRLFRDDRFMYELTIIKELSSNWQRRTALLKQVFDADHDGVDRLFQVYKIFFFPYRSFIKFELTRS